MRSQFQHEIIMNYTCHENLLKPSHKGDTLLVQYAEKERQKGKEEKHSERIKRAKK